MGYVCRIELGAGSPVKSSHADADEAIAFAARWLRAEDDDTQLEERTRQIEVVDQATDEVIWEWRDGEIKDHRDQPHPPEHG